jgi:hypothetical protein
MKLLMVLPSPERFLQTRRSCRLLLPETTTHYSILALTARYGI